KKDISVSEITPAGSVKALTVTDADSREFGFSTKYDLNEGLAELYKLTERERLSKVKGGKKKGKMAEGVIKTLETVVSFVIVTLLIYVTKGTWLESIVDLYLIYVVIVAATYGFAQGSLATILVLLAKAGEVFTSGKAFEFSSFISVPQIFIIGAIVGYMYDKHKRKSEELEEDKEYYQSELVDMTRIYDGNRYMKDVYESRIVNYENSMVKIYDAYNQMDHWEPQRVVFNAVDVVKELMDIDDVAIYIAGKNPSYMRLMASSTEKARTLGKSIKIDSSFFMKDAVDDKTVFRSRDLDSSTPTYGCGVYGAHGLTAIVMLWTDDLSKVNLYEANMLALVCKLMESAMNHAVTYWNDVADHFIEGTNILVRDKFKTMEEICKEGARENKIVFSTLKIAGSEIERGGMETCQKITSCVRDTDIVGEKDGDVYVLLMNTNKDETKFVMDRFANAGIQVVAQ
ncbi:MAG: NAD(P)-dependent oxidoreductase, partial [Clostridia bacterium]|nr:NAD(P)-dependent oxidoreductase [Clostridia bacterium]